MRILVLDGVQESGVAALRRPGWQVDFCNEKLDEETLVGFIGTYDALIVRSATKVTAPVINAALRLKVIGRAGVGVDNIDLEAATARGVMVVNAPDGNTIAAAEHTIAMMLALARNVPQGHVSVKNGKWERKKFVGVELRRKTLGILGLGRIGQAVARRAQGFEMRCVAYDPYVSTGYADKLGVELASFDEVLERADFLTVHLPLTDGTRHLLNAESFKRVKPGVRIINVARGGIIDESALAEALRSGLVAGAAVDVFEQEPLVSSELLACDNVVLTPHLGASTHEAQFYVAADVAEEIAAILEGRLPKNAVNMAAVPPEVLEKAAPYVAMAERLGSFVAQVVGGVERLRVLYSGALLELPTKLVTTGVLKGLLDSVLDEKVNLVNAEYLATKRGITLEVVQKENGDDYHNRISIAASGSFGETTVSGSLFRDNDPRIVEINGYRVDVVPDGCMLVAPHQDKPGIIGQVGTFLGQAGVNIAAMQVGRRERGGTAVMVLSVDSEVPPGVLDAIACVDGVLSLKQVVMGK